MRPRLRHLTPALALLLLGACAGGNYAYYDDGYAYDDDYAYYEDDDDVDYYEYEDDYDDNVGSYGYGGGLDAEDRYYGEFDGPSTPPGHMNWQWEK